MSSLLCSSHQRSLTCLAAQVAVQNSLLFENTYQPIPGYVPKEPTVSQVPTEIRGSVSLTIFNAGQTAITVRPPPISPYCITSLRCACIVS